jgi:hypothetical protein
MQARIRRETTPHPEITDVHARLFALYARRHFAPQNAPEMIF